MSEPRAKALHLTAVAGNLCVAKVESYKVGLEVQKPTGQG